MDARMSNKTAALGWAEVAACTLPAGERPLRLAQFDDLFARSLRAVGRTGDSQARLVLAGDADLAEQTQRLADAEAACCSFFTFTVTPGAAGQVVLDIEVPAAYSDVLGGLVSRAESHLDGVS
jgi:hypothetical protein